MEDPDIQLHTMAAPPIAPPRPARAVTRCGTITAAPPPALNGAVVFA